MADSGGVALCFRSIVKESPSANRPSRGSNGELIFLHLSYALIRSKHGYVYVLISYILVESWHCRLEIRLFIKFYPQSEDSSLFT